MPPINLYNVDLFWYYVSTLAIYENTKVTFKL